MRALSFPTPWGRLTRATVALSLVTIVCAGCAQHKAAGKTPGESRAEIDTVLSSIQVTVGGEWETTMSQALECSVEGLGGSGVQWTYGRTASRTGDMDAARIDVEKVATILKGAGYEVRPVSFHEELGYDVGSNNGRGSEVAFGTSAVGVSITAGSDCAAGVIEDFSD